jgi:hypothetical protein
LDAHAFGFAWVLDRCTTDDAKKVFDYVLKIKQLEGYVVRTEPFPAPKACDCSQHPVQICRALERVIHLPATEAAKALGLSARGFKRQLRAAGIEYWPGRAARTLAQE